MKKNYLNLTLLLFCAFQCYLLSAQSNEILMFVSHEDVYYSEYIVMKEALEASGYSVDVRNASGSQSSMYMVPNDATIISTANSLNTSDYTDFTNQYQDMFGVSWGDSLNSVPSFIDVDGSIQDVTNMSNYDALVIVGGTGALAYRVDGNYNSQGLDDRLIPAATVQSAAEKINALVLEALADGKPTMAQCHGASILPFCRIPDTSGPGIEVLGYSLLKGGNATGFPGTDPGSSDTNTATALSDLDITHRSEDKVTISSPHEDFLDNGEGDFKILTTQDWYPQTVAYAAQSLLNILDSYLSKDEMDTDTSVLILHGGSIDVSDCGAENRENDVPCNYGTDPEDLPADYTHLVTLLNADSSNDSYAFSVSELNINNGSLPYIATDQNSIESYFSNFDTIIFFKHWSTGITDELQNALVSYADDGGGVLALHHGLYNDITPSENKDIIVNDLFGAESHESTWGADRGDYTVYSTNYGHFISTFGVDLNASSSLEPATWSGNQPPSGSNLNYSFYQNFEVYDEIYTNMTFIDGQTFGRGVNEVTPIFSNNHPSTVQSHTTGFVKLFNPSLDETVGRAAFFEIAENRDNININHVFGQVVRNAVVWLANGHNDDTDTTFQDGNWEDTTTWVSGSVPNANTNVTVAHTVTINSDVECLELSVNNTPLTSCIITSGNSLSITNDLTTSDDVYLQSSATSYSSLIVQGSVSGQINYNRFISASPINDLVSSPVSNQTFGDFSTTESNVQLFENPENTDEKLFGPFDNTTGEYENYNEVTDAAVELIPGKGYRAATNAGSTLRFKALTTTANVSLPLTDESATGTGNYERWNLIGNPYPSYLDFGDFFTENSSEFDMGAFQAVYGYDGDDEDGSKWTVWNGFNFSDKIAPGQAFFVRAISGGGTVNFTTNMRTIGSSDDFILGRSATPNYLASEFFLSKETKTFTTKIYFAENQTRGLDPGYDAAGFGGYAGNIYTELVQDNVGEEFILQALPYQDFNDVIVPLGIRVDAGVQATIGFNDTTTNLPSSINIYLEDNVANTWTLLNTSDYILTPNVDLVSTGRFYIHFSNSVLSLNEDTFNGINIYTEQSTRKVIIKGQLNTETYVALYDIQGRMIFTKELDTNSTTNAIDANSISSGIYIVKLKSSSGIKTQKISLK